MRDTPADLISVKIGINLVNTDLMRLRAFGPAVHGFLDTIREGHPTTPLLVVSPAAVPHPRAHARSRCAGPHQAQRREAAASRRRVTPPIRTRLTLTLIREELSRIIAARAAEDPNLHYLDGRELYGEADLAELPLPDQLHPDAATHRLIGERFAGLAFGEGLLS